MSGSYDLLGDLVAEAQQGARGETGALELLERETEMRNLSKKAKTIIAGAAIAGLASTGVAYAYWTTTGSGSGTAATAVGDTVPAFSVTGAVPAKMFPGDALQTITATVKNVGTENYKLQMLTAWVDTSSLACDGSNFLINGAAAPIYAGGAVSLDIGPIDLIPTGTATKTYTIQFNNKGTEQNSCKNVDVTVHYAAS